MKNLITIIILTFTLWMNAQKTTINGTIKSVSNKESLSAVVVSFYNAKTDKLITYAYSDFDGNYKVILQKIPFYIKAKILGYNNYQSKIYNLSVSKTVNILMNENTTELDEVVLFQKKKLITLRGDKMIVDIENSGFGAGNNGIETLSKLPGMRLNKDDNLVFRGDGNLQILIDGKSSLLSGDDLKNYLKTLNGNLIKTVEIIANPSAKYDASGSGGIINIRLKENTTTGLTGSTFTSVGYGEFIKQYNGVTLFNNTEKWNINAGIYTNYDESVNHRNVIQKVANTSGNKRLNQKNDWFPISKNYVAKIGTAYKLTKNATIGATLKYNTTKSDEKTIGRTDEFLNDNYTKYTLLNTSLKGTKNILISNVYYSFATGSLDTKVDAQISYANYKNKILRTTKNQFLDAQTNTAYASESDVLNDNPTAYAIFNTKMDISHKFNKATSIDIGLKHSFVSNDYDMILKEKNVQGNYIVDALRSSQLLYKENISAFYGIGNYQFEQWNFQAGLRAEYINYKATSLNNNKTNKETNLFLFPSASINRTMDKNQYKLSYSRRIQRPRYLDLNPYFRYVDTYNVEVGNPDLKPQFTNVFDFTWVHNRKTSLSIYSKLTTNRIDYIFNYDENTQITTLFKDNIAKTTFVGASFNTSFDVTKWWNIRLNSDYAYNHFKSNIPNNSYNLNGSSWNISVNQSAKFNNGLKLYWSTYYDAPTDYGNIHYFTDYDMSLGLKKLFFNKKLRVSLKASNILKNSKWHSLIKQANVTTDWTNRSETRKFSLSLNYNFGNGKKKKVKDADLYDEQKRL